MWIIIYFLFESDNFIIGYSVGFSNDGNKVNFVM